MKIVFKRPDNTILANTRQLLSKYIPVMATGHVYTCGELYSLAIATFNSSKPENWLNLLEDLNLLAFLEYALTVETDGSDMILHWCHNQALQLELVELGLDLGDRLGVSHG